MDQPHPDLTSKTPPTRTIKQFLIPIFCILLISFHLVIQYGFGSISFIPQLDQPQRLELENTSPVMHNFLNESSSGPDSALHKSEKEVFVFKVLGTGCFEFVAALIVKGLTEVGFNATAVGGGINKDDDESIYIQTWSWHSPFHNTRKRFILYNWEQLQIGKLLTRPDITLNFQSAMEVWDYSPANIAYMRKFGINAKLIIPGYSLETHNKTLSDSQNLKSRGKVVGFSGTMNERRTQFLQSLKDANVTLFQTGDFSLLTQSRVVLNVHSGPIEDGAVLEVHRLIQLLPMKVIVISERSADKLLDELFAPVVTFFDSVEDCVKKVNEIMALSDESYEKEAERRYGLFKSNYPPFIQQLKLIDSVIWHPSNFSRPTI